MPKYSVVKIYTVYETYFVEAEDQQKARNIAGDRGIPDENECDLEDVIVMENK